MTSVSSATSAPLALPEAKGFDWLLATAAVAGDGALETAGRRLRLAIEVRGNLRDSEANRFPSPFPFRSDQLPVGSLITLFPTEPVLARVERIA